MIKIHREGQLARETGNRMEVRAETDWRSRKFLSCVVDSFEGLDGAYHRRNNAQRAQHVPHWIYPILVAHPHSVSFRLSVTRDIV